MFKNVSQKILADVKREQVVNTLFKEPKKSRRQIFKEWFKDKIQEFCTVTSLHGYGKILYKRVFENLQGLENCLIKNKFCKNKRFIKSFFTLQNLSDKKLIISLIKN